MSLADVDIAFIGGGTDREQRIACERLLAERRELASFVEDGGVLVAVCGGYQLLGDHYRLGDEKVQGLSLVELHSDRAEPRLIGNVAVHSRISAHPSSGMRTMVAAPTWVLASSLWASCSSALATTGRRARRGVSTRTWSVPTCTPRGSRTPSQPRCSPSR